MGIKFKDSMALMMTMTKQKVFFAETNNNEIPKENVILFIA